MSHFKEFVIVGRLIPSEAVPHPPLYKMRLFAQSALHAKSRFYYFAKKLHKLKKANGEILSVVQVYEKKPTTVKTFGAWIRYQSRTGQHNMYKEYRDTTRCGAVDQIYADLAARHRARFRSVQILDLKRIKASDVRRPIVKQLLDPKISFPQPHRVAVKPKMYRTTFAPARPNTHFA